jgi:hypothetical protein
LSGIEPVNLLLLTYLSRPGTEGAHQPTNNQVSHNTKLKSGKEIRQSNPPTNIPKMYITAPCGVMGRRDGNDSHQKKMHNSVEYEENGYPVTDLNNTRINVTKELRNTHKNTLKKEIWEETTEKLMEKILDMVNQTIQDALKKSQDNKNKEYEMTQKQIKELREDLSKQTKDTIKREIYELKRTTQIIKEELITDLENLEERIKKK